MAKLKRLLLWGGILLIGGILMLGAAANEMMSSILGDNQQTNITEDMLNGLPDWITPEMVQGAIDMITELWRKRNGHYADRRSVGNSNGGIFHICKL